MTHHQFVRALNALELGHASQRTAALLGVKVRQLNKLKTGKQKVSETMALLLNMYRKHGLPAYANTPEEYAANLKADLNRGTTK
jgi:plasmid maintenance system antidote protein VapI